jgi:hypothetical protein
VDQTGAEQQWGEPGQRPGAPAARDQLEQQGVTGPRRRMSPQGIQSWVDHSIQQAQRQGAFDDLAGAGRPLRHVDARSDPDWWVKGLIEREQLDLSQALPGPMQLRREKDAFPDSLLDLTQEAAVRERLEDFNERVLADRRRPVAGAQSPPVVGRVDVAAMVERWRALRAEQQTRQPAPTPEDSSTSSSTAAARRPSWWRRAQTGPWRARSR